MEMTEQSFKTYKSFQSDLLNHIKKSCPMFLRYSPKNISLFEMSLVILIRFMTIYSVSKRYLILSKKSENKMGWCTLNLKMEKTYNRIEWDIMCSNLQTFEFPHQWITWIQPLINWISYSLNINGPPTKLFQTYWKVFHKEILCLHLFSLLSSKLS